jgi:hypothetical protein
VNKRRLKFIYTKAEISFARKKTFGLRAATAEAETANRSRAHGRKGSCRGAWGTQADAPFVASRLDQIAPDH